MNSSLHTIPYLYSRTSHQLVPHVAVRETHLNNTGRSASGHRGTGADRSHLPREQDPGLAANEGSEDKDFGIDAIITTSTSQHDPPSNTQHASCDARIAIPWWTGYWRRGSAFLSNPQHTHITITQFLAKLPGHSLGIEQQSLKWEYRTREPLAAHRIECSEIHG